MGVRTPEIESILETAQNFLGVHSIVLNESINLKTFPNFRNDEPNALRKCLS